MTRTDLETFTRRWADAVAGGRDGAFDQLVTDGVLDHSGASPVVGRGGFRARTAAVHAALSDVEVTVDGLLVDGDQLAWRWTMRGTHRKSGRRVQMAGINVQRIEGGRVAEHWTQADQLGLAKQLE